MLSLAVYLIRQAGFIDLTSTLLFYLLLAQVSYAATPQHDYSQQQKNFGLAGNYPHADSEPRIGAVASESATCSRIGTNILRAGGSAADALVAAAICVGTIGCYHSGIGGGGFMVVRSPDGYEAIDFRESAPAAASKDMYEGNIEGSIFGGLSVAVPGELRGLEYLHQRYGKLSWSTVLQPSIALARDGFEVGKDLVRYMDVAVNKIVGRDFLVEDPAWAVDFAPNGTRVGLGDRIFRRRYAATLQAVSDHGANAFYSGTIADATIAAIRSNNGTMTLEDLKNYRVITRTPLKVDYKGFRLVSIGTPASGAIVLSTFKTIEGYELPEQRYDANLSLHRLDEAIRFGYAERASLGDPNYVQNATSLEQNMLSSLAAEKKRAKISDEHTLNVSDYNPDGFEILENHGTSHISTADASGMAISFTSTINLIFGSTIIVPETGVILNDEMNDFSIPNRHNEFGFLPSPSNYIRPGKRPMSSIAPVIVEHLLNNSLYYVVGAAGGSRIITATIQNLWHTLDHNMTAADALAEPRFHDQLLPNVVGFEWAMNSTGNHSIDGSYINDEVWTKAESGIGTGVLRGFDNHTVAAMERRGHNVTWIPPGYSAAHSLRLCWNGTFEAAGDPRQTDSGGFAI